MKFEPLRDIEAFLAQYPTMISALAAGATVAAVVTALYIARGQSRARLRVFADVHLYISSEAQAQSSTIDPKDAPQMIAVTMKNVGQTTVSIPYWGSFVWSVPGAKKRAMQNPEEPNFRHEPIQLLPGKSASIVLSHDLPSHMALMMELAAKSWLGKSARWFPRLTVVTEIGVRFPARLGKSLRKLSRGKPIGD